LPNGTAGRLSARRRSEQAKPSHRRMPVSTPGVGSGLRWDDEFIRAMSHPGSLHLTVARRLECSRVSRLRPSDAKVGYGASLCGNKARFEALVDSAWGEAALES